MHIVVRIRKGLEEEGEAGCVSLMNDELTVCFVVFVLFVVDH